MASGKEGGSRRSCSAEGGHICVWKARKPSKHWPQLITRPFVPLKAPPGSLSISESISLRYI